MSMSIKAIAPNKDEDWVMCVRPWDANLEHAFVGYKVISLLPALLIPVRTNTWTNFNKDLFSPTIHHAIRVKGVACQIFAVLGALLLDILTLPIRLLTCIPRHFYIISHPHPFQKVIQDELQTLIDDELNEESIDAERIKELEGFKKVFKKAEYVHLETEWRMFNGKMIEFHAKKRKGVLHSNDFTLRLIQQPQGIRLD